LHTYRVILTIMLINGSEVALDKKINYIHHSNRITAWYTVTQMEN